MIITYRQFYRTDKYLQQNSIFWSVCLKGRLFVYEVSGCEFESCCDHLDSDRALVSSMEFLDTHATAECRFTLKLVQDMIMSLVHSKGQCS